MIGIPAHKVKEQKDLNEQINNFFANGGVVQEVPTLTSEEITEKIRQERKQRKAKRGEVFSIRPERNA